MGAARRHCWRSPSMYTSQPIANRGNWDKCKRAVMWGNSAQARSDGPPKFERRHLNSKQGPIQVLTQPDALRQNLARIPSCTEEPSAAPICSHLSSALGSAYTQHMSTYNSYCSRTSSGAIPFAGILTHARRPCLACRSSTPAPKLAAILNIGAT